MKRRSGFSIMRRLIVELDSLAPIMAITITMGVLGYLAAIAIAVFGSVAIGTTLGDITFISFKSSIIVMLVCAVLRGLLRYAEQLSGHYIAFKILAILRDKVFTKLRKLAPAKLESKEKGNLISLITSDIELLEVFYAHTIAPIAIAILINLIITIVLYLINPLFGILGAVFFLIVGFVIPYVSSMIAKEAGVEYRKDFAESNSYLLDSLRGLKEILLFNNGKKTLDKINENSINLNKSMHKIKDHEGIIRALTDLTVMIAILTFVAVGFGEYISGSISFSEMIIGIVIIASSFGPVVALSNLSNNLLHTFACAERLFDLLDEKPYVEEISGEETVESNSIEYSNVTFAYPGRIEDVLSNVSLDIKKGDKVALIGKSGIGKSTFVKLLMRFWDVNEGSIKIDNKNIKDIPTKSLRESQTLVSQETYLFDDTIMENIKIGNRNATNEEVIKAAKKASIHNFIETLPQGYNTKVGELGGLLSSGEKQRIGLARAFVNEGNVLILDEPTSNLDTLNEAEILKSIKENCMEKTILLISHRKSTTAVCDKVFKIEDRKIINL
ncbi:thiol reductant ABC exporter subunit CydC [Clostridium neonatale]|uniref:ABC transporter, ATPase/permease components n=1 Tax=Clostridium neonatale TaxID=137838 RepID=A0AAD1YMJ2_9CLOT|nr:thiol reductant ABC exporter subunit CydC [Clostridium neonatale]CAI3212095.1 putative ABC transporter, ATPase/permease components [Clostridium neonatale]CAI3212203.1 putative ABC transporter, ATPase/permease components [Clostridium neonatale]CAI3212369.1 putative ABC transporter, ATPase/permease components [Clostridium neonatale]CAI3241949.1 putative ABC transporter, ATPase/permease components [Clostridium neonatale]CAI3245078.1 putative ABC transporter, ATPase/permease components [Clostri